MLDELVQLFERPFIKKYLDAFARGQTAFAVLTFAPLFSSALFSSSNAVAEYGNSVGQFGSRPQFEAPHGGPTPQPPPELVICGGASNEVPPPEAPDETANVESSFETEPFPHSGQCASSPNVRAYFSNRVSHE